MLVDRLRILLVEDDAMVCNALARLLGRSAEVTTACSVDAAAAHLLHDSDFDLVLCDVLLGPRPGTELYRHISKEHEALRGRVAFMTGLGDGAEELRDFRHVPCLTKPIDTRVALALAEGSRKDGSRTEGSRSDGVARAEIGCAGPNRERGLPA